MKELEEVVAMLEENNNRLAIVEKEMLDVENNVARKAEEHDDAPQQLNEQMLKRGEDLKNKDVAYSYLETCVAKKLNKIKELNEMMNEETSRLC